ncbi:MAG: hypothetical protein M3389_11345, partial [Actinomycetota bacterium]|nr:hypothetical protein [Actinomycetota bacterium]
GLVVADLLPPGGGRVDAAYAPATVPGRSRVAHVRIRSRDAQEAGLAVLCRRPSPDGSIIPGGNRASPPSAPSAAAAPATAAVCTRTVQLREHPRGPVRASGRMGQPLELLDRRPRWTRVRTDLGQSGWVPSGAVCAAP